MIPKNSTWHIKGMNRDLSVSKFNPEYAYENKNIRLMSTLENTLLSITNERGPLGQTLKTVQDLDLNIDGIPLGQALINDYLILFTKGPIHDNIYKIWFDSTNILRGTVLFSGDLSFNIQYPIETLSVFENNDIQKVYWVDGVNQPRIINIATPSDITATWNNNSFDFVRNIILKDVISITKNTISNGQFPAGVLQYAFSYYTKYGQESNIFYTSPLLYTAVTDRGLSPEENSNNSFKIQIQNYDNSFDYVKVYSILRTSIDADPECKEVTNIGIPKSPEWVPGNSYTSGQIVTKDNCQYKCVLSTNSSVFVTPTNWEIYTLEYIDTGTSGSIIDPTLLLYVGGEAVTAGTINQKDNTLFLGNITLERPVISQTFKDSIKGGSINMGSVSKGLTMPIPSGLYPYKSQLIENSEKIQILKYLEWYRFGIQAQHKTGKWSEPIWINDAQITTHISEGDNHEIIVPQATYTLIQDRIVELRTQGYQRVRPVIVYPKVEDRECVCQGILCPTVWKEGDRLTNSPYVQSSWFTRPNIPYQIPANGIPEDTDFQIKNSGNVSNSIESKGGALLNNAKTVSGTFMDTTGIGKWAEFRHNHHIPENYQYNAEIQCCGDHLLDLNSYYIDQSIFTMHSPDIEYDTLVQNSDLSNCKLRIVGVVPLTSSTSDIDIQLKTPAKVNNNYLGFQKKTINVSSKSTLGFKSLLSLPLFFDNAANLRSSDYDDYLFGYVVYPWHRNGSLNNDSNTSTARTAMLDKKKMSILRHSCFTEYFDNVWTAENAATQDINTGISGVTIFNSDQKVLSKIKAPLNSTLEDLSYYGNIEEILIPQSPYPIVTSGDAPMPLFGIWEAQELYTGIYRGSVYTSGSEIKKYPADGSSALKSMYYFSTKYDSLDSVSIKYKSTPHAVIALNYTANDNKPRILPAIKIGQNTINSVEASYFSQDSIEITSNNMDYGFLWLGELYNDNVVNRFGGQTEEAFENNQWLPCGSPRDITDIISDITLSWTEGDTYYQRYDHLKTYPFTQEDQNSVIDIISFMCETRINIDGRYDKNRGLTNNLSITPANFNLKNPVYSQQNNFFNYRGLNINKLNLNKFQNTVTWSKTKTLGELIDTWTNITMASTLDLDGDKGPIRSIQRLNNTLLTFQDKGIAQILYNENVQISSNSGVPIEIANSGKVTGKRYLSDFIGCSNKWSICKTPSGIYFIDDLTNGIYLFNGELTNISDNLGFHSWINQKSRSNDIWNPYNFNGFVTYYDKINGDVFFIGKDDCLAFSEPLKQFSSFYSYENTPYFSNLKDQGIFISKERQNNAGDTYRLWLHNQGDYNIYFNKYQPFYTTLIANPEPTIDKLFNIVEFRADTFETFDSWNTQNLTQDTFDTLTVWNEYQYGEAILKDIKNTPNSLKQKFRTWRANIPRDALNGKDRIRNTWAYLKLAKNQENKNKTILHDIIVGYFE